MRRTVIDWVTTGLMLALVPLMLFMLATGTFGARPSSATLSVTPDAASAWDWATASGCGYASAVYLDIEKPEALAVTGALPDAGGCFSVSFTTDGPGMYYLSTRELVKNRWRVMATYALTVQ